MDAEGEEEGEGDDGGVLGGGALPERPSHGRRAAVRWLCCRAWTAGDAAQTRRAAVRWLWRAWTAGDAAQTRRAVGIMTKLALQMREWPELGLKMQR